MGTLRRNQLMTARMLELPHGKMIGSHTFDDYYNIGMLYFEDSDGRIDYHTLGNMMVATLTGEV